MFFNLEQPLHELPAASQVKTANLIHFPNLVERLGGNSKAILERHDIAPESTTNFEEFIDCQKFVDMFEYCASKLNDPLFGYHLAELQTADVYGFIAAYCRVAPNLSMGLQGMIEFLPVIHSSESVLELEVGSKVSELRWSEQHAMGDNVQASYQGLLLNLKMMRQMVNGQFNPCYVNLPRDPFSKTANQLQQSTGCKVRLSDHKACIAFPTELLNQPLHSANQPMFRLLSGYLTSLKSIRQPTLSSAVSQYIRKGFANGLVSVEGCAESFGYSTRTLQIRLRNEGMSFSDILEEERRAAAMVELKANRLSIAEIADSLGYSERTSFGRAFKRWIGQSPQQYRQSFLEQLGNI